MKQNPYLAFFILVLGLLAGCAPTAVSRTTSFMVFGDPAEYQAYQELVAAFHAQNPDIQVTLTHVPSPQDYRTRLVTEFAAGDPPDITLMNYRRYASFAARGLLEPLQPYVEASELVDTAAFYPITIEAFRWDGELMCLPQNISSLVVYYNADLFDMAGLAYPADDWTWDEFVATAVALTQDHDGDGQIDQYGLGVDPSLFRLAPFVWQNGAVLVDDQQAPTRLTLTRPPAQEALQWFVDLRQVHGVVPGRVEEQSLDSESRFIAGQTAMYLNSRRGTPTYREIQGFVWDVAPLPQGRQAAGVLHSDAYCLSHTAVDKEAAWAFIEFANSVEGQTIIAGSGRTVPSRIAVAESPAFLDETQPPSRAAVFINNADSVRLVPIISTWQEIENTASAEIERAFYGDISAREAAILADQRTEEYFLLGMNNE
ncbi:MAG: sugar ABC transporter substrate-binding protein [Anaerolineales bacterium]|nr:sugar ABC transporter substrate-binding protein [Anaerolineales bacterium]